MRYFPPQKSNELIPKIAMFEKRYIFLSAHHFGALQPFVSGSVGFAMPPSGGLKLSPFGSEHDGVVST